MCFPVFTCVEDLQWFKQVESPHKVVIWRLFYMFMTLNIAIFFHDITALFQLTGPLYSLMLQTILPVLFYVKSYKKEMFESIEWLYDNESESEE
jgi:Mn2+/Fe2+ NRAMP family transporter